MEEQTLPKMEGAARDTVKSRRARYTPEENEMLFEQWWDPLKRRDLPRLIGRNLTALRSQFCRLLKEKGISNEDYYRLMGEKHGRRAEGRGGLRQRLRADNERDGVVLEIFAKHHALGHTKTKACEELRKTLGIETNNSALKLRFYRLMNKRSLSNQDLMEMGRNVLAKTSSAQHQELPSETKAEAVPQPQHKSAPEEYSSDLSHLAQLTDLPRAMAEVKRRLGELEETSRRQLDLRGFIEHLLAVERDLKEEDRLRTEICSLHEQNYQLAQETGAEKKRLKAREEELSEAYQLLNNVLGEYMNLESVAKLASLGDFIRRLEVTVDQFGSVLKCRRI